MEKIKVLYLIDTLAVGGAEKSLADIAINNPYIESIFVTIYKGDALVSLLKQTNIQVYQLENTFKYGFDAVVQQLLPLIDTLQPDIIHSTLFRSDIVARKIKSKRNIPLISSFVNNSYAKVRYDKMGIISKMKLFGVQRWDAWSAKKADLFISNSETIRQSNAGALGINLEKIKVIYRGRSSQKFDSVTQADALALRNSLGIDSETKVLLNVSRLLDRKGQLDLLHGFAKLVVMQPKTVLLIAGEGAYRTTLENEIEQLGLKKNVQLLGNRNDIPVVLAMADIFVFPSHYEGLPGALIEAMFAQKVIICSDIGENKECVSPKEAVFFKTGNVSDLADKMIKVLTDFEDYTSMSVLAKKAAVEKFELANVVRQYNETYHQLLEKS